MEYVKSKPRKEESVINDKLKRRRGCEHEKEKDKERDKEKRGRESQRSERDKSVDYKHRVTERKRNREKHRDKYRDKEERKKEGEDRVEDSKDRGRERERSGDREKRKGKEHEERARKWEREEDRKRQRERESEKRKESECERRERECGWVREREERDKAKERKKRRREAEIDDSGNERRHRDRKRQRRDDDYKERDRERSKSRDQEKCRAHRHKEDCVDSQRKKSDDNPDRYQETLERKEQEMEDEQRKLEEEMEIQRRRFQEWQELRRKKDEEERLQLGEENAKEFKVGKNWTLEGESDDNEVTPEGKSDKDMDVDGVSKPSAEVGGMMAVDSENGNTFPNWSVVATEEEEIDPLDAFMNLMVLPEVEKLSSAVLGVGHIELNANHEQSNGRVSKNTSKNSLGRIMPEEDSDPDYEDEEDSGTKLEDEADDEFVKSVKKTKAEKLAIVDHSKIDYIDFRKNFYVEVKEIARMTPDEVNAYRKELELKVRGKDVPKPIKTWHQTGLTTKILEAIRKMNFEKPMPIQAQAFPVIMSGRDCIGIAKTGSGKTLAFVLPMLRQIKDQPPLMSGDAPIGLIMAPTRELVRQIHNDIKKFAKVMNLTCVPVHGGSGVAQQIGDLKKGAEIVVCTPGRMTDILCTSSGKITNLRRVTFLVLDEADRMFDMGFEPQITRIIQNIRSDRQTVLFSATFPRQVEVLARKVLNKPVDIQVGGRSVVNSAITQIIEVRPESERFLRLLELLGEWYEKGKILIFVNSHEKCDSLFRDLLKSGYPCLSLHGAKDQGDRESSLADFKSNVCNLLIATSVAERGLDVKELELVVNFDVPNHYEEYVHRVGRTGRAGRMGHAITFISEEEAEYAPDLLRALELSEQPIPQDLKALADGFMEKVKQGLKQGHRTGYVGKKGYKFDEQEDETWKAAKKAQAKEYGFEYDKSDSEDEDDEVCQWQDVAVPNSNLSGQGLPDNTELPASSSGTMATVPASILSMNSADNPARAAALAAAMNLQQNLAKLQQDAMPEHYEAELEINDFPQNARWKVTHKDTLGPISDWTGAAITTRGQYYPPGMIAGPGERKLYLFIEGRSEHSVKTAKAELKRVLEDITAQTISLPGGGAQPGSSMEDWRTHSPFVTRDFLPICLLAWLLEALNKQFRSKNGKPEALSCVARGCYDCLPHLNSFIAL